MPAPAWLDNRAAIWFCAGHERAWSQWCWSGILWANFAFGRPPLVGVGVLTR